MTTAITLPRFPVHRLVATACNNALEAIIGSSPNDDARRMIDRLQCICRNVFVVQYVANLNRSLHELGGTNNTIALTGIQEMPPTVFSLSLLAIHQAMAAPVGKPVLNELVATIMELERSARLRVVRSRGEQAGQVAADAAYALDCDNVGGVWQVLYPGQSGRWEIVSTDLPIPLTFIVTSRPPP